MLFLKDIGVIKMNEIKWTVDQQNAISARNGSVLVSAAAGSGKTAVLVQRVIERITDPDHPSDVDRLLIVTFTNAAADQMRERISERLSDILADDPNNVAIERQLLLLPQANISTIHSFCKTLLRDNFYNLSISQDFRIADTNEIVLLKDEAIDYVLEEQYRKATEGFILLAQTFYNGKNDSKLVNVIKQLYEFIASYPYPQKWLEEKLSCYKCDADISDTIWEKTLLSYAKDILQFCIALTEKSLRLLHEDEKLYSTMGKAFMSDLSFLKDIHCTSRDELKIQLAEMTFIRLSVPRGYTDHPIKVMVSSIRKDVKSYITYLQKLFSATAQECKNDLQVLSTVISALFETVLAFDKRFSELKAEKNLLDFNDLEHFTVKLLTNYVDGKLVRTDEAVELSKNFDEIMVDEYQDTNETQDLIFRSISDDEKNLFVVGDVKQSIYGFRQAMPEIFLRRKDSYSIYDPDIDSYPAKIMLSANFRSRNGITDSVNFIFKQLMSQDVGGLEYDESEMLVPKAIYPEKNDSAVEFHLLDLDESFSTDIDEVEAKHIADIIKQKVSAKENIYESYTKRPVQYKDFCVLLRSANVHAKKFAFELEKYGIPCSCDVEEKFFDTLEITSIISLLKIIDNPLQDIPFIAAMMSPFFAFNADEASRIRMDQKNGSMYMAMKRYAAIYDDEKVNKFLNMLEKYRYLSAILSCSDLIMSIFDDTNFIEVMSTFQNGEARVDNLHFFVSYAKSYEACGYKTLAEFINFICKVEDKTDLVFAKDERHTNAVKVMSIHRSKGLEFPICFIANCSRKFNKDKSDMIIHSNLGVGVRAKDPDDFIFFENFVRDAISLQLDMEGVSEELRIFYVAMTRAKEKLYLISSMKNVESKLSKIAYKIVSEKVLLPTPVVRGVASFSDWILLTAMRHPMAHTLREIAGIYEDICVPDDSKWSFFVGPISDMGLQNDLVETKLYDNIAALSSDVLENFEFIYPYEAISSIPTKISVSELADKTSDDVSAADTYFKRPSFLYDQGLTPAEKGTALHIFMQHSDFKKADANLQAHVAELTEKGFLSMQQAKSLDMEKIGMLFRSKLMRRILSSDKILREFKFTINIPPTELDSSLSQYKHEYVVLQGAIDCAFLEDEKYIIVDYKTDKVSDMQTLRNRYMGQLELYRRALQECTKVEVSECILYSIHLGQECSF